MMKCATCGSEFPSKYYFVTRSLCAECFRKLGEEEQHVALREVESLSNEDAAERIVDGHQLKCPICGNTQFWKRRTLMNTPGMTFFGLDWANKQAENYVCSFLCL